VTTFAQKEQGIEKGLSAGKLSGMRFYRLGVGVLAVWRITYLLYGEDGPWNILVKLRQRAGNSVFGQLLDCFYCLSIWTALPVAIAIGKGWHERLLLLPALSAGAILLERSTASKADAPALQYFEAEERDHGVLRQYETAFPGEQGPQRPDPPTRTDRPDTAPGSLG
jgi:hypothetical protein